MAGLRPAGSHCENSGSSDGSGASARSGRAKQRSFLCPLSERGWRHPYFSPCLIFWCFWIKPKAQKKSEIDSLFLWESSVPLIGCFLRGADLPPFVTKRWRQKCPQGTSVGIGRRCSLSGHKRLRCCDAKDCTASTVAARQSPQAASALACCPSFSRPLRALEPPSDLIPPPVQCGDSCALCAMIIIRLRPHMAGLRPAGSHCEKSGKIPTLHCIPPGMTNPVILRRKSKPIPTQASPPASPSKQRRKRPCPIGFRHICPKTEK